jgi:hypothetical protein
MIKNEQQYGITVRKLGDMRARIDRLRAKYPKEADFQFYSAPTLAQVEQMQHELDWYELAKAGKVDSLISLWNEHGSLHPKSKNDIALGDLLALLRVARGMRQEDLAKNLGIDQAHVARYEGHDYTGYSIDNLDRLLRELGVRLMLGKGKLERAA